MSPNNNSPTSARQADQKAVDYLLRAKRRINENLFYDWFDEIVRPAERSVEARDKEPS
jgi:hypothetical protein